MYRRLRIHADQSGIIKTETSEKSSEQLNFFKKYLNQTFKTNKNNYLSVKGKRENRSQNNHYKINSHRALFVDGNKNKITKKPQTPKLRQLSEVKSVLYWYIIFFDLIFSHMINKSKNVNNHDLSSTFIFLQMLSTNSMLNDVIFKPKSFSRNLFS